MRNRAATTVNKEHQCEVMSRNEKDICDAALPKYLEMKSSSLPGAAMGVFALLQIENNFHFWSYDGERLELHETEHALKSKQCWLVSNGLLIFI